MTSKLATSAPRSHKRSPYVYVNVLRAEGLRFESSGKVYCDIIANQNRIATSAVKSKPNPKWREEFLLVMTEPSLCVDIEIYFMPSNNGIRKSQIFPRRGTKGKNDRIMIGSVSINLGVVHEEGALVEDWFVVRRSASPYLTDLPIDESLADKKVRRTNTRDPPISSEPSDEEKIYLGIQYFRQPKQDSNIRYSFVLDQLGEPKYQRFIRLLVNDNLRLLSSLVSVLDPSDLDKIAPPLVRLFDFQEKIRPLWRHLLQNEVDSSENSQVLFRSNSMASKVLSIYAKMVGLNYLQRTIGPVVREVMGIGNPEEYEMDPIKLGETVTQQSMPASPKATLRGTSSLYGLSESTHSRLSQNSQRLKKVANSFLKAIFASSHEFPNPLRAICSDLFEIVSPKFPNFVSQALASFVSLRFVNPSIVAPESHQIIDSVPSMEHRRVLVIAAKVVQNVFNATPFTSNKEDYMQILNSFVHENIPLAKEFLSKVSMDYPYSLPTPTVTQRLNQRNYDDHSKYPMTITRNDGRVIASQMAKSDILADVSNIHTCITRYVEKIGKLAKEDEWLQIPMDQLQHSVKEMNNRSSKMDLPYADYNAVLEEKGAIQIENHSDFDVHWRQQQQLHEAVYSDDDPDILNDLQWDKDTHRNPVDISMDLVRGMLDLYMKHEGKWATIRKTDEFLLVKSATSELKTVDFSENSSYPDLMAFWINLYNCLIIHIHILLGPPTNKLFRKMFFTDFSYIVGPYRFSLEDIRDGILRGNPKMKFMRHRTIRSDDPRRCLAISAPLDPRVHFALSVLNQASPIVRVYSPATLQEQLHLAGEVFLGKHLTINFSERPGAVPEASEIIPVITVPSLIERFSSDFGLFPGNKKSQQTLLIFLFQFLNTKKRLDLLLAIEAKEFQLNFTKSTWEVMNVRHSIRVTHKNFTNNIHDLLTLMRCVCSDLLQVKSVDELVNVGKTIHTIAVKIREKKDLFRQRRRLGAATRTIIDAAEAPQKISLYAARARNFLEFVSLSPEQMVNIPRDKQGIFLETMRKIFLEAEDVVSNLSQFIMEDGYADNADTVVTLNIICKDLRNLDEHLHEMNQGAPSPHNDHRKNMFLLIQAIASETADVTNILRMIDKELDTYQFIEPTVEDVLKVWDSKNKKENKTVERSESREERRAHMQAVLDRQNLLINIAVILRYVREQLDIDIKKTDKLLPFESKTIMLTIPHSDARLADLKAAVRHSIKVLYTSIQNYLEQVAAEKSPKQILLLANKIRNIRNALRQIKGKKLKMMSHMAVMEGAEARLTVRMVNASMNNIQLMEELALEDLQMLERMLLD